MEIVEEEALLHRIVTEQQALLQSQNLALKSQIPQPSSQQVQDSIAEYPINAGAIVGMGPVLTTSYSSVAKFVAVTGTINTPTNKGAYSYDGINWTASVMPSTQTWINVAYGSGKYIAIARKTNISAYSYDGINWTASTMPANLDWTNMIYANNMFVVIPQNTRTASYSYDGINWKLSLMPSAPDWSTMTYGNGVFSAISFLTSSAAYSYDGINWTASAQVKNGLGTDIIGWSDMIYANNMFVATAIGPTASYSYDGINWTASYMPADLNWYNLCYGKGKFVAVQQSLYANETTGAYSYDGINWTASVMPPILPTDAGWVAVAYGNEVFSAIAADSATSSYSYDGINWTASVMPASQTWTWIYFG